MMNTWTHQKGMPLVLVKCEGNTIQLQQDRFLKGVFEEDPEWANLQSTYLHYLNVITLFMYNLWYRKTYPKLWSSISYYCSEINLGQPRQEAYLSRTDMMYVKGSRYGF